MKFYDLQQKLFGVQIEKSGFNKFSKYKYSTKEDVIKAVQEGIAGCGLYFIPRYEEVEERDEVDGKGKVVTTANVKAIYRIGDMDSERYIDVPISGSARDTGDKAVWKAYTGIFKYFWMRTFGLQDNDLTVESENDSIDRTNKRVEEKKKKKIGAEQFTKLLERSDEFIMKHRDSIEFTEVQAQLLDERFSK